MQFSQSSQFSRSRSGSGQVQPQSSMRSSTPSNIHKGITLDTYLGYMDEAKSRTSYSLDSSQNSSLLYNTNTNVSKSTPTTLNSVTNHQELGLNIRLPSSDSTHPLQNSIVNLNDQQQQQSYHHLPQKQKLQQKPQEEEDQQQSLKQHPLQLQSQQREFYDQSQKTNDENIRQIIYEQQQQILKQQLHRDDPQILESVNPLDELDELERDMQLQLEEVDRMITLNFDLADVGTDLLPEELDQLINITRLEALAKELEGAPPFPDAHLGFQG